MQSYIWLFIRWSCWHCGTWQVYPGATACCVDSSQTALQRFTFKKIYIRMRGWSCSEWMSAILPYLHLHDHPYSKGSGWLWWMDKEAMTKKWGCQAFSRCCDLSMPSREQWTASGILKVSKSSACSNAKKTFYHLWLSAVKKTWQIVLGRKHFLVA